MQLDVELGASRLRLKWLLLLRLLLRLHGAILSRVEALEATAFHVGFLR